MKANNERIDEITPSLNRCGQPGRQRPKTQLLQLAKIDYTQQPLLVSLASPAKFRFTEVIQIANQNNVDAQRAGAFPGDGLCVSHSVFIHQQSYAYSYPYPAAHLYRHR
jgi:hypothetical protein